MSWDAHIPPSVGRMRSPTRSQHLQVYSNSNRRHPWEIGRKYSKKHIWEMH